MNTHPNYDAIIIGGGIMGGWISLELAAAGLEKVLLLEKRYPGAGSSGKSGAILRQHYSHETTIRMARTSLERYANFEEEHGFDIGFRRVGMVFIAPRQQGELLEANIALQRENGVQAELIGRTELGELEPSGVFTDDDVAAWEPEAGYVHPVRTVHACLDVARRRGVEVRVGAAVRSIEIEGGRTTGVRLTNGERIGSGVVVNAAGPWARALLQAHGIDAPLRVIRPEQAFFQPPVGSAERRTIYGDLVSGLYWKPEDAGWTRVGQLAYTDDPEVDPDHYDEGVSGQFIGRCRSGLAHRLPDYRNSPSWGGCGALYTVTPDAHALIGPIPGIEGLHLVSGFSGHGFKMGPAVGCGVAAAVAGIDPGPFDPAFFAVDRFQEGRTVDHRYAYGILG